MLRDIDKISVISVHIESSVRISQGLETTGEVLCALTRSRLMFKMNISDSSEIIIAEPCRCNKLRNFYKNGVLFKKAVSQFMQ